MYQKVVNLIIMQAERVGTTDLVRPFREFFHRATMRSSRCVTAVGLLMIATLAGSGSDDPARLRQIRVEELSSEEIASRLLQHGAPNALAQQVIGAALDGTQVVLCHNGSVVR